MANVKPKILILDIETAYMDAKVWSRFPKFIPMSQVKRDYYMLCWAAKWLGDDYIYSDALFNHKTNYKADPRDDSTICETLWPLLDEADLVIAHNGEKFDKRRVNTRLVINGFGPPSPYKMIDTYRIAKKHFAFTGNSLNDLCAYFGIQGKLQTDGQKLWDRVVDDHCLKSFKQLLDYNENDIEITEPVYERLAPWYDQHPNPWLLADLDRPKCNSCGSHKLQKRGTHRAISNIYQRYQCQSCGRWMRGNKSLKLDKTNQLRSI